MYLTMNNTLNEYFKNRKNEFSEAELENLGDDFFKIISEKFPRCQIGKWGLYDGCDEIGDDLFSFGQVEVEVTPYFFVVRGDDDGYPVLDIVHDSNIIGVYHPKDREHFIKIVDSLAIK